MVMTLILALSKSRPHERLIVCQGGQNPKDNRYPRVQRDPHERVADTVADVFEVHGGAFDEHADRDDCVKGLVGHSHCGWLRDSSWDGGTGFAEAQAKEIAGARASLDVRSCDDPAYTLSLNQDE